MDDAPSAIDVEKANTNLEDLFDDEDDSDNEFASSAPQVKSEEALHPAATLYATPSLWKPITNI